MYPPGLAAGRGAAIKRYSYGYHIDVWPCAVGLAQTDVNGEVDGSGSKISYSTVDS